MRCSLVVASLLAAGCTSTAGPPSLVLISLDTLRADRLGLYGYGEALSPNLDAFGAEAVVFERAYSQANVTNMSHASLFSGRYPSELGPANDAFVPATDVPLMAEILNAYGYQTAAAVGGGHIVPGLGLERGFDHFDRPAPLGALYHTAPRALALLDSLNPEQPFLLFVHGYDTHVRYLKPSPIGLLHAEPGYDGPATEVVRAPHGTPYLLDGRYYEGMELGRLLKFSQPRVWSHENRAALPQRAAADGLQVTELSQDDLAHVSAAYDGAVSYMDAHFGLLMAALEARGVLETAWVIVVSDHGESLGEDGLFCHNLSLDEATLRVPLMIRPPGGLEGGLRVSDTAWLLDVLPTVLDLAEVPLPALQHGSSLLPALEGQALAPRSHSFAEGQARMVATLTDQGQLTLHGASAESPYLSTLLASAAISGPAFELSSVEDPLQREAMREAMLSWRASLRPSSQAAPPPSQRELDAMRKHGYWSTR